MSLALNAMGARRRTASHIRTTHRDRPIATLTFQTWRFSMSRDTLSAPS